MNDHCDNLWNAGGKDRLMSFLEDQEFKFVATDSVCLAVARRGDFTSFLTLGDRWCVGHKAADHVFLLFPPPLTEQTVERVIQAAEIESAIMAQQSLQLGVTEIIDGRLVLKDHD